MATPLNIALYSPYVPKHAGGGERYFFQVAASAVRMGHSVTVLVSGAEVSSTELREKYSSVFGLDLAGVRFSGTTLGSGASFFSKLRETARYDVLYYLTDGSLFFSLAKKNILHIQFPFAFPKKRMIERLKLKNWSVKNANSEFTRGVILRAWKTPVQYVHYPPVDSTVFTPRKKEHVILSVGRFFSGERSAMHCKRQDVLVEAFRSLCDRGCLTGWKLVLIGAVEPGLDNEAFAEKVSASAQGYPIEILHDVSFAELSSRYGSASMYWHAAGYGVDEYLEPTKVEHFGIAPLEAMAAGAVPLVVAKGGLRETVEHENSGFLWKTREDLEEATIRLAEDEELLRRMSVEARKRAQFFNLARFEHVLAEMLNKK